MRPNRSHSSAKSTLSVSAAERRRTRASSCRARPSSALSRTSTRITVTLRHNAVPVNPLPHGRALMSYAPHLLPSPPPAAPLCPLAALRTRPRARADVQPSLASSSARWPASSQAPGGEGPRISCARIGDGVGYPRPIFQKKPIRLTSAHVALSGTLPQSPPSVRPSATSSRTPVGGVRNREPVPIGVPAVPWEPTEPVEPGAPSECRPPSERLLR